MGTWAPPRVVLVTRKSDYERLLAQHGTREQARFFLERRGQEIGSLEERHAKLGHAIESVQGAVPGKWRRSRVDRGDLSRFVFEPADLVVVVGQDGLVANVAKYLEGQPVIGINPDAQRYDGVLVRHDAAHAGDLLGLAHAGRATIEARTMVEAVLDDGQRLLALNEIFIGHRSHQSARYRLCWQTREERQSSSGIIVATGTGSTGWARSIHRQRASELHLPKPVDRWLAFFVREAFPSVATGTALVEGDVAGNEALEATSEMDDAGVVFGDGIEEDRLALAWGRKVTVRVAEPTLNLVAA